MWAQEEPANQGPWPFIALNLPEHLGRPDAASGVAAEVGLDGGRVVQDARAGAADADRAGLRPLSLRRRARPVRAGWPACTSPTAASRSWRSAAARKRSPSSGWPTGCATFVDLFPEFETPVERLATWLARLDDDDDLTDDLTDDLADGLMGERR